MWTLKFSCESNQTPRFRTLFTERYSRDRDNTRDCSTGLQFSGRSRERAPIPLIFRPNWAPPLPYLKVWICYSSYMSRQTKKHWKTFSCGLGLCFKLYWIAFSANTKSICYRMNISLISVTLHFKICWHSFTQLQKSHQNHFSYVWTESLSGMDFVSMQKLSGIVQWWVQGACPPLIFGPNWDWKGPKKIFKTALPPLISGSGWLPRPLIWRSGSVSAVCTKALRLSKYCSHKYL